MTIERLWDAARVLAATALVLALALGCASRQGPTPEEVQNERRAKSHYDLGLDHLANGRPELALRELLLAERLDPDEPYTQFALSGAYLYKGKFDESEQHLLRALEIHPEYHEARLNLSTLYIQQGRFPEALEHTQLLLDDPTFPAPWRALTNHGWAQLQVGQGAEARRNLEAAVEYDAKYWPALLNLGILEAQEGHRLEAIELFEQMLALEPDANAGAEANFRLAEIYVSLGNRDRALGHLMAAVAQTPNGQWGKKSEEYLKLLR